MHYAYYVEEESIAPEERDYPTLVKEVRDQLGLSQEDLARELGVSFATVNRWENGRGTPSPLAMRHIEELMERTEEKE